jgi:hypothetical protein
MSYGTAGYGTTPYGGAAGAITIARAWATSTRTIHVETTTPAKADDPLDPGDALNPATWLVNRLDTMAAFTPSEVMAAGGDGLSFDVTILESLASHLVSHRIGSTTLLSQLGALITNPYQATFTGMVYTIDPIEAVQRRPIVRDLANPPRGNPLTGEPVSAILVSGGNYVGEIDKAVVKKGIIRRLTTPIGSIRHLPNYGIRYTIKGEFPSGGDREALRVAIEKQCLQEPGVDRVRAVIAALGAGTFRIGVAASMIGGLVTVAVKRESSGRFITI